MLRDCSAGANMGQEGGLGRLAEDMRTDEAIMYRFKVGPRACGAHGRRCFVARSARYGFLTHAPPNLPTVPTSHRWSCAPTRCVVAAEAVVAGNDMAVPGVRRAGRARGKRAPEGIHVMSYGNWLESGPSARRLWGRWQQSAPGRGAGDAHVHDHAPGAGPQPGALAARR